MTDLEVTIEGRPVPYQRTRGAGNRRYTDPVYGAWKEKAGWLMRRAMGSKTPVEQEVAVRLEVSATGVHATFSTVTKRTRPKHVRGDLDNYLKALLDASNKIIFDDDRRIVEAHIYFVD